MSFASLHVFSTPECVTSEPLLWCGGGHFMIMNHLCVHKSTLYTQTMTLPKLYRARLLNFNQIFGIYHLSCCSGGHKINIIHHNNDNMDLSLESILNEKNNWTTGINTTNVTDFSMVDQI